MSDRVRPYLFYDTAVSICSTCLTKRCGTCAATPTPTPTFTPDPCSPSSFDNFEDLDLKNAWGGTWGSAQQNNASYATVGVGSYSGGGEFMVGANVTSTGDSFTNNTIPGPTTSLVSSEGAGLATIGGGSCTSPGGATSQATNLIAAGNSIGA